MDNRKPYWMSDNKQAIETAKSLKLWLWFVLRGGPLLLCKNPCSGFSCSVRLALLSGFPWVVIMQCGIEAKLCVVLVILQFLLVLVTVLHTLLHAVTMTMWYFILYILLIPALTFYLFYPTWTILYSNTFSVLECVIFAWIAYML